ncbi:hypothetical protein [Parasphingopyxis marina]|uniref:DUF4386 family protein n=1 Tax=Parasphingopyxis marina TaxID=2761622 RepID=A0A842HUL7_9SPHN|nr:hypothetical protein [Parasphingopyxis marina]MBC2776081.1 hypothetical protein [Parasphingopyxis marina]
MKDEAKWWWRCAGAGLVTTIISFYFGMIPNIESCAETGGNLGSIIAFEIVRTPADVATLFGEEPCRSQFLAAMRHATWVDALAFIPAYAAFLICGLIALRSRGPKIAAAGVAAVLLAALFDEIEGMQLFAIMADLPGGQSTIDLLIPMVRGKFALLSLAALAIGWLIARIGGFWPMAGLIVTAGGAIMLFGATEDARSALLGLGGLISWTVLLAMAIARILVLRAGKHPQAG